VVSGVEPWDVQVLDLCPRPSAPTIDLLWPRFRMAGLLLDRCDSFGLFAAHAVFCQQSHAPRSRRRRKLQQERLVAGSVAIDGLGRKLAQKPPLPCWLGAPRAALVAARHRMVLHALWKALALPAT